MNTMNHWACLLLFCSWCATTKAQTTISGYVTGPNHQPLAFVSVVLLQNKRFIQTTTTNEAGQFQLSNAWVKNGHYTLRLSLTGYRADSVGFVYPDTSTLARITLTENSHTLHAITVTAQKPLVTRKADRYIINVENSFLANGNSGLDVLQKSPGIWVNGDGSIRIKGNQPVTVMINDVVQRMSEAELADYLRTLKSEDISKIEVIPNPPSEYEAAGTGGIIHIILKKPRKDGFTGSVFGLYRQQGQRPYATAGASLDYKIKNLYLFASYSYTTDKRSFYATNDITYPDKSLYTSRTDRNDHNTSQPYRLGMVYDLSKNQSLSIQTIGNSTGLSQLFVTGTHFVASNQPLTSIAHSNRQRSTGLNSTTLNYVWKTDSMGSLLKIIGDYTHSSKAEVNNFSAVFSDTLQNTTYRNSTPNTTTIYSAQADFTKELKRKTTFRAGVKYASTRRNNELINENYLNGKWILNPAASNHYIYTEQLLMFYASIERTIQQTSIKAGLRGEQTYANGNSVSSQQTFSNNYFGLFPSLFVMQTLDEKKGTALYVNYARRLKRPGFNDLNPYRLQFDSYTVLAGNPALTPQYTHNVELGYNFWNGYSASIYFSGTQHLIAELANPVNNNLIEYKPENFKNSTEYGLALNAPIKVVKGWSINNSVSAYHLSYSIQDFNIRQTSFMAKTMHNIALKNIVDMDILAEYHSPSVNANSRAAEFFYCDIGFSRRMLNNKVRLRLYAADIFNTAREKTLTTYNHARIDFYQKRPTRTISLSFIYHFSFGKTFSQKKIDQSNNDEKNRIGN